MGEAIMTKYKTAYLIMGLLLSTSGCAICSSPYDHHFSAHGGYWERHDPSDGRVGSILHPAGPIVRRTLDGYPEGWDPEQMVPRADAILSPADPDPWDDDPPPELDLDFLLPRPKP
jgi:hypothetical protein